MVSTNTTATIASTSVRWSSDQRSTVPYLPSIQVKNFQSFEPWLPRLPSEARSMRELSIGVSVKLTSIDTRMANAMVQPNSLT